MEKRFSKIYPQSWAQILLLIGFCFFLFFFNLNRWDLWSPDEPRYAQVAREMVDGGDWVLMHYNGKVYGHKPPLFFWLIGLSSLLWQGFTPLAARFPSALFGALTVLVTFLLGKSLYSSRAGFLSGLILATSFEFTFLSTRANIRRYAQQALSILRGESAPISLYNPTGASTSGHDGGRSLAKA